MKPPAATPPASTNPEQRGREACAWRSGARRPSKRCQTIVPPQRPFVRGRPADRATGKANRLVDANREQAETLRRANRAYSETKTPETTKPRARRGRCPGKPGRDQ